MQKSRRKNGTCWKVTSNSSVPGVTPRKIRNYSRNFFLILCFWNQYKSVFFASHVCCILATQKVKLLQE